MGTRGGIVRVTGNGTFAGRYHHFDSYPEGLGKTLWELYRQKYDKNLDKMMKELIDDHPAGWSSINNCDWTQTPGYGLLFDTRRPQCYCHGERNEEEFLVNEKNLSGSGGEWVYAFNKEDGKDMMYVLSSYVYGRKMIGMFGQGNPNAEWKIIAKIELDSDEEPNWEKLHQRAPEEE